MRVRAVAKVLLFAVVFAIPEVGAQDLLLWDGETDPKKNRGVRNSTDAHRGDWCFEATPDAFSAPKISLGGLPSFRCNLSTYDEIWFFAKTDTPGSKMTFSVGGFPLRSNEVPVANYIEGGKLTTAYKLVKVPIPLLKTNGYDLKKVDSFFFGNTKAILKQKAVNRTGAKNKTQHRLAASEFSCP